MIRSCILPENEFIFVNKQEILHASSQFYVLYESLFSTKNCTYSIHVLLSHLLEIRSQGPFTSTSAFEFENFYGEMRRSFTPGTVSTVKQMMEKIYLKRAQTFHSCSKPIYYSDKDTALERNSLIYVHKNANYEIYQISKIDKNNPDTFFCNVQGKIDIEFVEANDVDWSKVGVFKEGAIGQDEIPIQRQEIHGKVLKICSLLITCPKNVLQEK